MACYTIVALHSADVVVTVRKVIFVWSAQAGLDLPMVDVRIWELLPTFLTLAASSALLVEVGYMLFVWHPMVHPACLMSHPITLYKHVSQPEQELHAKTYVGTTTT